MNTLYVSLEICTLLSTPYLLITIMLPRFNNIKNRYGPYFKRPPIRV